MDFVKRMKAFCHDERHRINQVVHSLEGTEEAIEFAEVRADNDPQSSCTIIRDVAAKWSGLLDPIIEELKSLDDGNYRKLVRRFQLVAATMHHASNISPNAAKREATAIRRRIHLLIQAA